MKTLYLGIDPPANKSYVHYPIIKVEFKPISAQSIQALIDSSHLIFTSKNGVRSVKDYAHCCQKKTTFAVGKQTANLLYELGYENVKTAELETAEGLVDLLKNQTYDNPYFVWPHSSLSRNVIEDYLKEHSYRYHSFITYDTHAFVSKPFPNFDHFEEIVFTSPSTVTAFLEHFGQPPAHVKLTPIGPVTEQSILLNFYK